VGKLIFWFVIGLVILTVARIAARAGARSAQQQAREQAGQRQAANGGGNGGRGAASGARRPSQPAAVRQSEQMVRCAHCGIHLPRSEAVLSAGETYCGQEHARLGAAQKA
jgi:uncharacterized protein